MACANVCAALVRFQHNLEQPLNSVPYYCKGQIPHQPCTEVTRAVSIPASTPAPIMPPSRASRKNTLFPPSCGPARITRRSINRWHCSLQQLGRLLFQTPRLHPLGNLRTRKRSRTIAKVESRRPRPSLPSFHTVGRGTVCHQHLG